MRLFGPIHCDAFFAAGLVLMLGAILFPGIVSGGEADPRVHVIHVGERTISVRIDAGNLKVSDEAILKWVQTGADAVSNYLGKFPVDGVTITVGIEGDGHDIHGTEYDGNLIRMRLGPQATADDLADDWTITHEMLHLAFPDMGDEFTWMNEGLSVYLEPVARARVGIVSPERYWRELFEGMEKGQPAAGDKGLNQTHTWGRTYWGGTIFWFLVDVHVREQTNGKESIDDVVKTILAEGGDGSRHWTIEHVLQSGDRATGTHVMHEVYDSLAPKPTKVDMSHWRKQLGVEIEGEKVHFDDAAPLAAIRKAILSKDGTGTR